MKDPSKFGNSEKCTNMEKIGNGKIGLGAS
ncbi:hypothetical protein RCH05_003626 [Janthinobacterium sp. CAN_S7]